MKKLIKSIAASVCLAAALTACSSTPSQYDRDSANYGSAPTADQVREGVRALTGDNQTPVASRLSQGWAPDPSNPGGYVYGWEYRYQPSAQNGGGTVTALFHDGILITATRDSAGQAKPTRIK
jgi:hypothetical protein